MNKTASVLLSLLILSALCLVVLPEANAVPKTIIVPDDFPTIQDALNQAGDGDTLQINSGTYTGNVNITKHVTLKGQNASSTTVNGGFIVLTSGVVIDSLRIVGSGRWGDLGRYNYGVMTLSGLPYSIGSLQGIWGTTISNCIFESWVEPIMLMSGDGERVINNTFTNCDNGVWVDTFFNVIAYNKINCSGNGITLGMEYQTDNLIYGNAIAGCKAGIVINWFNHNNSIIGNNISLCQQGIHLGANPEGYGPCSDNTFFHNNFVGNSRHVFIGNGSTDVWDDGYPSGGNYWSNYTGADTDHDGIGDTPQILDSNNRDHFPLMVPYKMPEQSYLQVSFSNTFKDRNGVPLNTVPTSFKLSFPNGTTSPPLTVGTYLMQTGTTVLHSVIWQGTDVTPDAPSTFDAALGNHTVNCKVYQLTVNPFFYNVTGNQTEYLSPSSWTLVCPNSTATVFHSQVMFPQTQGGTYEIRNAVLNGANMTFPAVTEVLNGNMNWTPIVGYFESGVGNQTFAFDSNSTISQPDFNDTSKVLSFTASGTNGTTGYTKLTFTKTLALNPASVAVFQDGEEIQCSIAPVGDAWLLAINYTHSTHRIAVDFDANGVGIPEFPSGIIVAMLMLIVSAAAVFQFRRSRRKFV